MKFSLRELFLVVAFCALCVGWFYDHKSQVQIQQSQSQIIEKYETRAYFGVVENGELVVRWHDKDKSDEYKVFSILGRPKQLSRRDFEIALNQLIEIKKRLDSDPLTGILEDEMKANESDKRSAQ